MIEVSVSEVREERMESEAEETQLTSGIQPAGFVLELSQDWIIQRASENVHKFLGEYHVRLIGEPLASFTMAQPLHDLRNALSRQGSGSAIARAYRVRLVDAPRHFDFAFQMIDGRILLEGLPSSEGGFGAGLGSVARLIAGIRNADRRSLMDDAARRMRALTGFDRVSLVIGEERVESSRGNFGPSPSHATPDVLPGVLLDTSSTQCGMFPRNVEEDLPATALLRSPSESLLAELREQGVGSVLNVPVRQEQQVIGWFSCKNRAPCEPNFELHAAADLFAQVFAIHLARFG